MWLVLADALALAMKVCAGVKNLIVRGSFHVIEESDFIHENYTLVSFAVFAFMFFHVICRSLQRMSKLLRFFETCRLFAVLCNFAFLWILYLIVVLRIISL